MFCAKCGEKLSADAMFCNNCGNRKSQEPQKEAIATSNVAKKPFYNKYIWSAVALVVVAVGVFIVLRGGISSVETFSLEGHWYTSPHSDSDSDIEGTNIVFKGDSFTLTRFETRGSLSFNTSNENDPYLRLQCKNAREIFIDGHVYETGADIAIYHMVSRGTYRYTKDWLELIYEDGTSRRFDVFPLSTQPSRNGPYNYTRLNLKGIGGFFSSDYEFFED